MFDAEPSWQCLEEMSFKESCSLARRAFTGLRGLEGDRREGAGAVRDNEEQYMEALGDGFPVLKTF